MSDCAVKGPNYVFGDCEWVCTTHGDVVCEMDDPHATACREAMRCPIGDPRPWDSPLEYESRGCS